MPNDAPPPPEAAAGAPPPPSNPPPPPPAGDSGAPAARPDYIPEKFWDAKNGKPNIEGLAKSYANAESELGRFKAKAGAVPASPDAYQPMPAADSAIAKQWDKAGIVLLDKPPGADFKPQEGKTYWIVDQADPKFQAYRDLAHRHALSQEGFQEGLGLLAQMMGAHQPTAEERKAQAQKVYAELGENGQQRADHVWKGLVAKLGEESAGALDEVLGSGKAIAALEKLLETSGGPKFQAPAAGAGPDTASALKEADALMAHPDYYKQTPEAAAMRQKVDGIYARAYPGKKNTTGRVA